MSKSKQRCVEKGVVSFCVPVSAQIFHTCWPSSAKQSLGRAEVDSVRDLTTTERRTRSILAALFTAWRPVHSAESNL